MTINEAFDEVVESLASQDDIDKLVNLVTALGHPLVKTGDEVDCTFMPTELKAATGSLLVMRHDASVSAEAANYLKTVVGRMLDGKPADGIADSVFDADIDNNLDCI